MKALEIYRVCKAYRVCEDALVYFRYNHNGTDTSIPYAQHRVDLYVVLKTRDGDRSLLVVEWLLLISRSSSNVDGRTPPQVVSMIWFPHCLPNARRAVKYDPLDQKSYKKRKVLILENTSKSQHKGSLNLTTSESHYPRGLTHHRQSSSFQWMISTD